MDTRDHIKQALKVLTIEGEGCRDTAVNVVTRWSKKNLTDALEGTKFSRVLRKDVFPLSLDQAVIWIAHSITLRPSVEWAENQVAKAEDDFIKSLSSKACDYNNLCLLDALIVDINEIDSGLFSFYWKQNLLVTFNGRG